jgi:hypothetical protein
MENFLRFKENSVYKAVENKGKLGHFASVKVCGIAL